MKLYKVITLLLGILVANTLYAQTGNGIKPEVGKVIPSVFFDKVDHYKEKTARIEDFRGKWVFLTFWSPICHSCVRRIRELDRYQELFGDSIQCFLVGITNSSKNIRGIFEKLRKSQGWKNLPITYDSTINQQWDIRFVPTIIIIDPAGNVTAITDGRDMNAENIRKLIQGKDVSFYDPNSPKGTESSWVLPKENNNLLSGSLIKQWEDEVQSVSFPAEFETMADAYKRYDFVMSMVPLSWLYNTAYFGKFDLRALNDSMYGMAYHYPILEMKDTSCFSFDYNLGKGLYVYNLQIPKGKVTVAYIQKCLREDLSKAFPYEAIVEEREIPVWYVRASAKTRKQIETSGGTYFNSANDRNYVAGFETRNTPFREVMVFTFAYLTNIYRTPFINDTGIDYNVDLKIDADLTDLEQIKKCFDQYGIKLIKGKKKMKVLVIRDRNT